MLVDQCQPLFIQKYTLIKNFFEQLRETARTSSQPVHEQIETPTQRLVERQPKPRRVNYISKKEPARPPPAQIYRPSDLIMMEQNKSKIDQLCNDNFVLYSSLQDCMKVIEQMKNKILMLQQRNPEELEERIQKLQLQIAQKDQILQKKQQCMREIRQKYDQMMRIIEQHSSAYDRDWDEVNQANAQLETENAFLRKLLKVNFTEEQLEQIQKEQNEVEFSFYDNFCISRKDLDKQAILEYEKLLSQRKQKIENEYVQWNIAQLQRQPQIEDFQRFGEEVDPVPPKQKTVSKEEKNKIMEELLKPIGNQKPKADQQLQKLQQAQPTQQQQFFQEDVKKKQLDILSGGGIGTNNDSDQGHQITPQKREQNKSKLALEIDISQSDSQQQVISLDQDVIEQEQSEEIQLNNKIASNKAKKNQKDEIMSSLSQGWQKLLNHQQANASKRYTDEEEDDQVVYKNNIFPNQKTIFYDQDDYYDEDDDDEIYQQIMEQQRKQQQKPTLTKTKKNQELQYQN